jgi:ATP-dependent Clp protease adaptor protein ClpS
MSDVERKSDLGILERPDPRVKEPDLYRVLLHNDDYTTMDFVVEVLEGLFRKSPVDAHRIMMRVHLEGRGEAGIYPHEVAETKIEQVHEAARSAGFPLRASLEKA